MPFRIFLIPVLYSDEATEELNAFIAGHRVAHIERKWIDQGAQSAYVFCVEFVLASPTRDGNPRSQLSRNRIDYKTILTPDEFTIFSLLRELRKELSQQEGCPCLPFSATNNWLKWSSVDVHPRPICSVSKALAKPKWKSTLRSYSQPSQSLHRHPRVRNCHEASRRNVRADSGAR